LGQHLLLLALLCLALLTPRQAHRLNSSSSSSRLMMPLRLVRHSRPQRPLLRHLLWRLVMTQPPARMLHSNSCAMMLQFSSHHRSSRSQQTAAPQQQQHARLLLLLHHHHQQQQWMVQQHGLLQCPKPLCL
jgi:hypothetical protein